MNRSALMLVLAVILLMVLSGAFFVISETEQVVITQFGKPIGGPLQTPGLNMKVPMIQEVHRFDKRFLEWDGNTNELPTKDKRFIWVDTYARWRITDPLLFFQRLRDESGAQTRLDDILDGETRNAIANHELVELVRSSNRAPQADESQIDEDGGMVKIQYGREKIRAEILANAQSRTGDLGLEILDLQFKRIAYVEEVQRKVYDRMIAERQRIAQRFRSEGEGDANRVRGELDRDLKKIQSEAYRKAQEITGKADAEATEIYAGAYDKSADSRQFYEFLKTMETYEMTVDQNTWLLLSTDSDFYGLLKDGAR